MYLHRNGATPSTLPIPNPYPIPFTPPPQPSAQRPIYKNWKFSKSFSISSRTELKVISMMFQWILKIAQVRIAFPTHNPLSQVHFTTSFKTSLKWNLSIIRTYSESSTHPLQYNFVSGNSFPLFPFSGRKMKDIWVCRPYATFTGIHHPWMRRRKDKKPGCNMHSNMHVSKHL